MQREDVGRHSVPWDLSGELPLDTFSKYAILLSGVMIMLPFAGASIDQSFQNKKRNPTDWGRRMVDLI